MIDAQEQQEQAEAQSLPVTGEQINENANPSWFFLSIFFWKRFFLLWNIKDYQKWNWHVHSFVNYHDWCMTSRLDSFCLSSSLTSFLTIQLLKNKKTSTICEWNVLPSQL